MTDRPDAATAAGDLPVVLPCWPAGPSDTLLMQTSWSPVQRCFGAGRQGHRLWEFSTALPGDHGPDQRHGRGPQLGKIRETYVSRHSVTVTVNGERRRPRR